MEQNSAEWHQDRLRGVGGSDAPVILGISPWTTPRELWAVKTGRASGQQSNFATERGHRLEPRARALFELEYDFDMPPTNVVSKVNPIFRASLDGWNEEHGYVLELKCPGEESHKKALTGEIPEHYKAQIEHQLYASEGKKVFYGSYFVYPDGREELKVLEYESNPTLRAKIIAEVTKFWEYVVKDIEPPITDRDYLILHDETLKNDQETLSRSLLARKDLEAKVKEVEVAIDAIDKIMDPIIAKITTEYTHPLLRIGDVSIKRFERKGAVDYSKVPALKGYDIEEYRKKPTTYYKVSRDEKAL